MVQSHLGYFTYRKEQCDGNEMPMFCISYWVRNKWLQVNGHFPKAVNNIKAHVGNITGISYDCFHKLNLDGKAFSLQRVDIAINSELAAQLTYPGRWTLSCWTTLLFTWEKGRSADSNQLSNGNFRNKVSVSALAS